MVGEQKREGASLRGLKLVGIQFMVQRPPQHWPFNLGKMVKTNLYPWKYFPVDDATFAPFFSPRRESRSPPRDRKEHDGTRNDRRTGEGHGKKDIFTVIRCQGDDCPVYTTRECAHFRSACVITRMTQSAPTDSRIFSRVLEMKE